MKEKIIKLTETEMFELDNLFYDSKQKIQRNGIIIAVIGFIVSLIPMGFLPRSGRLSQEDKSQNIIQAFGFGWWLLIFAFVITGIVLLMMVDKRIFALKKDREEGEKQELDVVITKKVSDSSPEYYCMLVSNDTVRNLKIVLEKEQFRHFYIGQKLTIFIYRNSKVLHSYIP